MHSVAKQLVVKAGTSVQRTSISFISFMASMMQMVWPLVTLSPSFTNGGSPGAGARYSVPAMGDATCINYDRDGPSCFKS